MMRFDYAMLLMLIRRDATTACQPLILRHAYAAMLMPLYGARAYFAAAC